MSKLLTNIDYNNDSSSGNTNMDVHIFLDKSGNVVQIRKVIKSRLKFYIDPVLPPDDFNVCAIGVSDAFGEDCTDGISLGFNENNDIAAYNYL